MKVYLLVLTVLSTCSHYALSYTKIIQKSDDLFPVSIIHMNDFHARYIYLFLKYTMAKLKLLLLNIQFNSVYRRLVYTLYMPVKY